ncbi:hypothetical protein EBR78_11920, partial [bacterium]|nr:hypothetical protein [bacterium]
LGAQKNTNSQIADAAVYLTKELGRGKMMVDIPVSYRADNVAVNAGFATAFRSFNTKAQAYVSWGYDFGLSWQLGRFDSPFLNEANDTVGLNAYTTQGILFGALPRMHNGLMLTYGQGPVTVMGIASRADGRVTAKGSEENAEWAVLGKYTHDMMYVGAGLYLHKPTTETHQLIEVMAGTKMGDLSVDAQAIFTKAAAAGAESGIGLGASINYAWDKMWSFGIRPNYLSKVTANNADLGALAGLGSDSATVWHRATTSGSQFQVTVGPEAKMTDEFRMRANYTYNSVKANANANSESNSVWAVSGVYKF